MATTCRHCISKYSLFLYQRSKHSWQYVIQVQANVASNKRLSVLNRKEKNHVILHTLLPLAICQYVFEFTADIVQG